MMTLRPEKRFMRREGVWGEEGRPTLGPEGDADGLCKDVDASEHGGAAIVGKLNFLVSTTGEHLCGGGSAAEGAGGGGADVVHFVILWGRERGGRKRKKSGRGESGTRKKGRPGEDPGDSHAQRVPCVTARDVTSSFFARTFLSSSPQPQPPPSPPRPPWYAHRILLSSARC